MKHDFHAHCLCGITLHVRFVNRAPPTSRSVPPLYRPPCLSCSAAPIMSDQRGLLAPGSQQEPPAGEVAPHAFPQAIAVPAPPAAAPAPASMYSAPMASGGGTDGAAVMTTIPMDPHNPYGPGAVAVAPPPVPQAAVVSPYDPYGQPLPQHHQQQQQHQQHQQQPPMQPPQVPQHVSPMHPTQKQAQFSAAAAPPMTAPQVRVRRRVHHTYLSLGWQRCGGGGWGT